MDEQDHAGYEMTIDNQRAIIDALVAALEAARSRIVGEWWEDHPDVQQIDAALALARKVG
ncbi:hypothetical protein [Mesorhizobium sp. B2-2-1]|uniref:hypothetical protein n=1 Tax=Mesorhizobium sp. B2-2-1 TaxID=2589965 RepID=UPI00112BC28B|nr:hypothetical protein [Mesorhizobium sp. B2-2-1]TPM67429.1 hypothetical protein FJ965_09840 [Mesorhizobium sp. B2-2-1]